MNRIFKFCVLFTMLFLINNVSYAFDCNAEVKQGNVVYTFESGRMQCLSEIDSEGHTWALIKSLDENTTVNFNKTESCRGDFVLVLTMLVKDTSGICASWVNIQEVKLVIDPIQVEKTTLSGKPIYEKNNLTVMQS